MSSTLADLNKNDIISLNDNDTIDFLKNNIKDFVLNHEEFNNNFIMFCAYDKIKAIKYCFNHKDLKKMIDLSHNGFSALLLASNFNSKKTINYFLKNKFILDSQKKILVDSILLNFSNNQMDLIKNIILKTNYIDISALINLKKINQEQNLNIIQHFSLSSQNTGTLNERILAIDEIINFYEKCQLNKKLNLIANTNEIKENKQKI